MTMYTIYAIFTDDYASKFSADTIAMGDVLKVIIRHMQHFTIVLRLNIE